MNLALTSSLILALSSTSIGGFELEAHRPSTIYWYQGEPLPPHVFEYRLHNTGTAPLDYTASLDEAWVDVAPRVGSVAAGATLVLEVSLNAKASALGLGKHPFALTISTAAGKRADRTFFAEVVAGPYAAWSNGPTRRSDYFPVAVWLQEPDDAAAYAAMDVNTYVGLWQGPTQVQVDLLAAAGMRAVTYQNDFAKANLAHPVFLGWMQKDEPDNFQWDAGCSCYVDPIDTGEMQNRYALLQQTDPTRPVFLNLGQAVAHADDLWKGSPYSGALDGAVYTEYLKATDVGSFDYYPVAGSYPAKPSPPQFDWVADGVTRMNSWVQYTKPVGNVVETTRIGGDTAPTPDEVELEVWLSLVNGSRWLTYFCHEFNPTNHNALLDDPVMRDRVAEINADVRELAAVLNAPEQPGLVELFPKNSNLKLYAMARAYGDRIYVFVVSTGQGSTELEVRIPRLAGVPLVAEDLASGAVKSFKKSLKLGFQGSMVRRLAITARD